MNLEIIQQELKSTDFVLKTQLQIAKDFSSAGIYFPSGFKSIPLEMDQLIIETAIRLKELETHNASAFSQLLYRIDIPESILPELSQSEDYYSNLSEHVIKREAYKVFLKNKFSS